MAKIVCEKCAKPLQDTEFYQYRDGRKTEMCKKCMTMHIDNFDPETYLWLLEKMDVPYVPYEWNILRDRAYEKDPKKMNGMSVFGKYLAKMHLKQFKDKTWADSEALQEEYLEKQKEREVLQAQKEALVKEQYEKGEITESQYKTLMRTSTRREATPDEPPATPYLGENNFYDENNFIPEEELEDLGATLTKEDKIYLAMKWGRLYTPSEWIELEDSFNKMNKSFDIHDADSINTLILLCKTNLKANQAIDSGDIEGFQKLSKVSESLRKTANFTAAQNKKDKGDFVDSIGELIAMCEKDGFIPRFATDIPQDKVDITLKDQKDYIHNLITQDLGFGAQIESAMKKIEIQKQMEEDERVKAEQEGENYDPFDELTDANLAEFFNDLEEQINQDLKMQEGDSDGIN